MNTPKYIIVHHSACMDIGSQLNNINEWHKQRGFLLSRKGYFVGYHYVIEKNGITIKTKDHDEEGCHCTGYNSCSIGICLAGHFSNELPTKEQKESLKFLLSDLSKRYKISLLDVRPHRKFADTECYGNLLSDNWASLLLASSILDDIKQIFNNIWETFLTIKK